METTHDGTVKKYLRRCGFFEVKLFEVKLFMGGV
jgi:hypothetical protein